MASNRLDVTVAQLRAAAKKIRTAASQYLAAANKVNSEAISLKSMWKGDSQVKFEAQRQKNVAWFKKMYNLMMAYSAYLEKMADDYEAYDASTAQTIGSSH